MKRASRAERLHFFRQFLRNPRELGSIVPSSRFLTGALMEEIDFSRARRIVELGAGTGVFTVEILRRLAPDGTLLALDTNAEFVAQLRREIGDSRLVVVHGSAEQLGEILAAHGWEHADVVISGIPYSLLTRQTTAAILQAIRTALGRGGLFVGYQYSPYLRPFLCRIFGHARYRLVLRNVPPAFVYVSRKPGRSVGGATR